MAKTKAGKGCGSCKQLVGQLVDVGGRRRGHRGPVGILVRAGIPYDKPTLMRRDPRAAVAFGVFGVRRARAGRQGERGLKMALASLLEMMWADEFVDERDARFINDRVHANIQRDGTFSVVPQMKGGVTSPRQLRQIADVADKYDDPDDQAHRRPAHRPARGAQGGPARGVGGPGHAVGIRLRQEFPDGENAVSGRTSAASA